MNTNINIFARCRFLIIGSLCIAAAGACVAGCSKKSAETEQSGAAEPPVASSSDGGAAAAAAAEPAVEPIAEPIAESEVAAVVEAWLGAQNQGDFDAYQALYAGRFTGIKRAGTHTRQYDRDGWIEDRGRMFRRKMTVTAADPQIVAGARTAVVTFTQTWASGSFQDVGPKQLVIVREDGALRIAREEMLRSMVQAPGAEAAALAREDFVFALGENDLAYVVLDTEAEEAWATSDTLMVSPGAVALRAADRAALPEELSAWLGRQVTLFTADGTACTGPVASFAVMTGFEPHFGTAQEWRDRDISDEQLAREVWDMGAATRFLVGRVAADCAGAWKWARASDRPAPVQYARAPAGDAVEAVAIRRFRALAGYRAVQKTYTDETGKTSPWDEDEGGAPSVVVFRDPASGRGVAAVSARAGQGCGAFYGEFWALFELVERAGEPALVLLTDETEPGAFFIPELVVDLVTDLDADGDGSVALVGMSALVRKVGAVYRHTASVVFPSYDCPC